MTQNTYVPEKQELQSEDVGPTGKSSLDSSIARSLNSGRRLLFRLKWTVMSPEKRYAHLWAVTRRSPGYLSRN